MLDLVRNRDIAHMLCFSYRFDQPLSTNTQFDIRERSKRLVCWFQTEATHGSQRLVFSMNIPIMQVIVKNNFICLFVQIIFRQTSLNSLDGYLSRIMRKPDICLCENKAADQLCSNCTADQRLCFRYSDSTTPLLLIAKLSSLWPASVTVKADLCQNWSKTPKTGFLAMRLICCLVD